MTKKSFIEKEASNFSGREKAEILLKHFLVFGEKKEGFLTESEIQALVTKIEEYADFEEYRDYCSLFMKLPFFLESISNLHKSLKYYLETLKNIHLLINLSPAIEYISCLINDNVKNKEERKRGLQITNMIQTIQSNDKDELIFSDSIKDIKKTITLIHGRSCSFLTMKTIFKKVIKEIGSNFSWLNECYDKYQINIDKINQCIKEHNKIISGIAEDRYKDLMNLIEGREDNSNRLEVIKEYLIPEPTFQQEFYDSWVRFLFEEESEDDDKEDEEDVSDT